MIIPGGRDRKYKEPGVEECLAGFRVKSEVSERSELVFKIRENLNLKAFAFRNKFN